MLKLQTIILNENEWLQPADFYLEYAHHPLVIRNFRGISFDMEKIESQNFEVILKDGIMMNAEFLMRHFLNFHNIFFHLNST